MKKNKTFISIIILAVIALIVGIVFGGKKEKTPVVNEPEESIETSVSEESIPLEEEKEPENLVGKDMDEIPIFFDSSKYFIQTEFMRDETKRHEEILAQEIIEDEDFPDMKTVVFTINILEEEFEKEKELASGEFLPFPNYLGMNYHDAYLKSIEFENEYDILTEFVPYEGENYNEEYLLESCVVMEYNENKYELDKISDIQFNEDGTINIFIPFDEEYGIYKVYVVLK